MLISVEGGKPENPEKNPRCLEYHHSVARDPALQDCSYQIDAKANEKIGLDLKTSNNP